MATRSPICVVLGHVDHGKSSILDYIRGTRITAKEAGAITQAIGASVIPMATIQRVCGKLLDAIKFTIPGLLFIDTPGHGAFSSLRKRGGSLADIAILVVDINEGLKQQTIESMQILRESKTPFVIAANKIDLVPGFKSNPKKSIIANIAEQQPQVMQKVEQNMYELVGKFYEAGMKAERFDRVGDYTQELAIIPCSAHTGDGMPELLMVMSGLAQKYLEKNLEINVDGPGKGTILEVKEQKGLGVCVDAIIYDGVIKKNDTIIIGGIDEPIETKIRVLLQPSKVADMRDKGAKFVPVPDVHAATGVRISAPHLDQAIAGMPIRVISEHTKEMVRKEIQHDVTDVLIETDTDGIILKADTLGSVEALISLCNAHDIPIRKATLGNISKKDVIEAESNFEKEATFACILGFNVRLEAEGSERAHIITSEVIYELLDRYTEWKEKIERIIHEKQSVNLIHGGKCHFLPNCSFRQSNPAIIGVEVLGGVIAKGRTLIKGTDGSEVGFIKSMQLNKENVDTAKKADEVALSLEGPTIGRQIHEDEIYFVNLDEEEFRKLKEFKKQLTPDEIDILKEFAELKRKNNPLWGV